MKKAKKIIEKIIEIAVILLILLSLWLIKDIELDPVTREDVKQWEERQKENPGISMKWYDPVEMTVEERIMYEQMILGK